MKMTLHLARLQARQDEAQFIRSPEESKERCEYLQREIEREEKRIFGVPAATQEPAGSGAAIRETAVTWLAEHKKAWSGYDLFSLIRIMQPGSPRKVGEDGPVTRETLEHWLRVVKSTLDPDGWDCDAPELRRMREQLEALLARPSSVPVGEQKQEEGV